jgi:L-rhamnose mutarotase
MKRAGFLMKLSGDNVEQYKKRHDEIWPELEEELKDAGISDYTIYFDETTRTLFATQKLTDENAAGQLPGKAIVQKWWAHMADLMETEDDNTTPFVIPLREVFHLH